MYVLYKVLFDLFDLNEVESLSKIDIEFMFFSCIISAYKIFNIGEGNYQDRINEHVSEFIEN